MPYIIVKITAEQKEKFSKDCEVRGMTKSGAVRAGLKAINMLPEKEA